MKIKKLLLFSIWQPIKERIKLYLLRNKIREKFQTALMPDNVFPIEKINSIGKETYGFFKLIEFGEADKCRLNVGSYCSIGQEVTFILGGEHPLKKCSTYPFDKRILGNRDSDRTQKGDIVIEDDVWIGYGSTIMSGVRIGQGAVIGAKSVIAKDIPPYAICVGAGKIVRYRFPSEIVNKLLKIDYSALKREDIEAYKDIILKDIDNEWFSNNPLYNKIVRGDSCD